MPKSSGFLKFALIFLIFTTITTAAAPLNEPPDAIDPPECGDWIIERDDERIKVSLERYNQDASCSASFTLENKTGKPIVGGGYSFALTTVADAADVDYVFPGGEMLMPGLIMKFTASPSDPGNSASVAVYGGINLGSYLGDAAFFLLRVGIDQFLPPGTSCLLSEEEFARIVVQSASVLVEFVQLALSGDVNAAVEELAWVQDIFYKKAGDYFTDAGIDCMASISEVAIDKAKLMSAFLIWYSSVMFDYWKKPQPVIKISYVTNLVDTDDSPVIDDLSCLDEANKIAFVSNRDGNNEIYLMNADGSCQTRITEHPDNDFAPKWALAGTNLVYATEISNVKAKVEKEATRFDLILIDPLRNISKKVGNTFCNSQNNSCSSYFTVPEPGDVLFYSLLGEDYGTQEIRKVDLSTLEDINLISEKEKGFILFSVYDMALSPSKNMLVFGVDSLFMGTIPVDGLGGIESLELHAYTEEELNAPPPCCYPEYFYYEPIWSPDGEKFIYLEILPETPNAIFNINRYNVNTKNFKTIYSVQSEGSHIRADGAGGAWIPNSDTVVFSLLNKILLLNTKTGEVEELTSGTNPSLSSDNRQLVFERDGDIYRINLDGSGEIRLTHNQGENIAPAWQPKSLREEFSGNGKIIIKDDCGLCVNTDIFSVNADGSNLMQVIGPDIAVGDFDVSLPAGKVAFHAYKETLGECLGNDTYCSDLLKTGEIYSINLDGTQLTRLTDNRVWEYGVSWSPDGSQIAFVSDGDNYLELNTFDQNGAGEETIWRSASGQSFPFSLPPLFSPYGDEIIFSINNGVKYSLIKADLQLNESSTLVESLSRIYDFSWSPDGEKILYGLASKESGQLFVMNSDGTMNNPVSDSDRHLFPRGLWSPDSRKIAVLLLPPLGDASESSIFLTDPEGNNREELEKSKYRIEDFHWLPDSMKLIYLTYSDQTTDFYAIDILSKVKQQVHSTEDYAYLFELSPDGKEIAFITSNDNGNTFILNLMQILGNQVGKKIKIDSQLSPYLYMPEVVTWLPGD